MNNNTTVSLFSPKRSQEKRQQQNQNTFNQKKLQYDFNKEKILNKFDKKKNGSTNRMQIVINNEEKEKDINNYISSNFLSNFEMSPKSIRKQTKSSKKSINNHSSKRSSISGTNLKNSLISKKIKKNLYRKSNTIVLPTKTIQNLIVKSPRKLMFKHSTRYSDKDKLTILTLKEIGNKLKKTITDFDFNKLKKDLEDFETNQFTDIIKNLPKKPEEKF